MNNINKDVRQDMNDEVAERREQATKVIADYFTFWAAKDLESWIDLWADDCVQEWPYAFAGHPARLEGKAAMYEYGKDIQENITNYKFSNTQTYPTLDSDTFVVEYQSTAEMGRSSQPYRQTYIAVFQIRDGKIALMREYWNPVIVMEALGKS